MKYRLILSLLLPFFITNTALAATTGGYPSTDAEFAMLPPYCRDRLVYLRGPKVDRWAKKMGKGNFMHIHHYCKSLNTINLLQTMKRDKIVFPRTVKSAHGGIDYVLEKAQPKFRLRPEMHTKKAYLYSLSGDIGNAVNQLNKAIQINPKYARAYGELSDLFLKQGDKKNAKAILLKGLKFAPNSKGLKRRLKKL